MPSPPLNDHEMLKLAGPIGLFAAGTCQCYCYDCGHTFLGAKDARQCLPCAVESLKAAQEPVYSGEPTAINPMTEEQMMLMIEAAEAGELDMSCPSCGGAGGHSLTHRVGVCCGVLTSWGECCGETLPVETHEHTQCEECVGTGIRIWPK